MAQPNFKSGNNARYAELELLLRQGLAGEVGNKIAGLLKAKLARSERAEIAHYANRAGLSQLSLRLLTPLVRPKKPVMDPATDREKTIYAGASIRCGGFEEALRLLSEVDSRREPEALLQKASALVAQWDYANGAILLARYIDSPGLSPYQRLVGKLNLAASCLFHDQILRATILLRDILHETKLRKYARLHANALQLSAQNFLRQRNWNQISKCLALASEALRERGTIDLLLLEKWKAVAEFVQNRNKAGLDSVRKAALLLRHWETLRDCDRFQAEVENDDNLLKKVYFGTPFDCYRKNLLANFPHAVSLPEDYGWCPTGSTGSNSLVLLGGAQKFQREPSRLILRLLTLLAADFYSAQPIATLYYRLFPQENFSVETSPPRIHEAVRRARRWLESERYPLTIEETFGQYRLRALADIEIVVAGTIGANVSKPLIARISAIWPSSTFSISEAAAKLSIARRTLQRDLESLVDNRKLVQLGNGPSTRYLCAK